MVGGKTQVSRTRVLVVLFCWLSYTAAAQVLPFYSDETILSINRPIILGGEGFEQRIAETEAERGNECFGLVLSGGSARAFAHIGVLQVMEEEGLRPDFIVADSMGAVAAILYCAGIAPDDIAHLFDYFPANRYFDPQIPLSGGFLDAGRFIGLIQALLGDLDLSKMPIPVLIVCEDLVSRRQVLLAEGDAATVMAAAIALPAVFEPVKMKDLLLIDGGVTNLVPVDVAYRYSTRIAAATALYNRNMNFASPFVVINRAIDIGKTRTSVAQILDHTPLVIRCDVEELSYMQFSRPSEVIARGRASTQGVLSELRTLVGTPRALSAELKESRERYKRRVAMMIAASRMGAAFPVRSDILTGTDIRLLDEAKGGSTVFTGRRWAGPSIELRGGPARLGLSVLAGLEGDEKRAWGFAARTSCDGYLFPDKGTGLSGLGYSIRADALLSGSGSFADAIDDLSVQELASCGTASLSFNSFGTLVIRPLVRAELDVPLATDDSAWTLAGGLSLAIPRTLASPLVASSALEVVVELDSDGNLGPAAALEFQLTWADTLALRSRSIYRQAVEGPGMEAAASDPYRSAMLEGRSTQRFLSNLELAWIAHPLEIAFGELVIIERPEIGMYIDVSGMRTETDGLITRTTVGGAFTTGFSIMGLTPMSFSCFVGAAMDGSGWTVGLRAGRYFE